MTDKAFSEIFRSLSQYYRLKADEIPDKLARTEYYRVVKFIDDTAKDKFYSEIVGSFKFFPKIPEIKEVAEKYRPKLGAFHNDSYCYCCLNVGHVTYIRTENDYPYEYLARCPYCAAGKNYPELPSVDMRFRPEEIQELIKANKRKYGDISHEKAEASKMFVREYLKEVAI